MSEIFWLREETKKNEFRRALVPDDCKLLINAGHKVVVEDWSDSIIKIEDYKEAGCEITSAGSWINASENAIIVGLKALPDNITSFKHRHIYFAHAYKEQDGWKELIEKFKKGNGKILDLEFMTDDNGRRVCAFGYWAGYVGAALGALTCNLKKDSNAISILAQNKFFKNKDELISFLSDHTDDASSEAIVIGSAGRSGQGAIDCLSSLNWKVTAWDKEETVAGGPFKEILNFDLFVNCVLALKKMPPFIDTKTIENNKNLKVISDVSCDPDSECNMVPLYAHATTLDKPFHSINANGHDLKLIAIDNLPSVLPFESSIDFSSQLTPYLVNYSESNTPMANTLAWYVKTRDCI